MPREQSTALLVEGVPEAPFYIPATGASTRPRRTLKHDDCFAVLDSHGDIGASTGGPDGIFFNDTRYLSHLEMRLNGEQPLLLGSNVRDDNSTLTVDLTNGDIYYGDELVQPKDVLHVVRTLFIWRGTVYQRVRFHNHGDRSFGLRLSFEFVSDFADVFEVRGMRRKRRGTTSCSIIGSDRAELNYFGLDGLRRQTSIVFEPTPRRLSGNAASYVIELPSGEATSIFVTVHCDRQIQDGEKFSFRRGLRAAFQEHRAANSGMATVTTSNEICNEIICRSMADLAMLSSATPQGRYPYAGIPWYSTTFGRDGIITAMQMLWCDPRIAEGVLRRLAMLQATTVDRLADAEPGKILHEMRAGEMAALREVPFALYYGSVDATPLFVLLAGLYGNQTGDLATLREIWPNIEAALGWIDGPGDADGDGFVEYNRAEQEGLLNQGWKDSHDAVFHANGEIAAGPIALCEVQGYVYAAKRLAARCARRLDKKSLADTLDMQAAKLAERFESAILVPGYQDICARVGWAKATLPGPDIERWTGAVQWHRET
jgi:glycogen debranching enzyme